MCIYINTYQLLIMYSCFFRAEHIYENYDGFRAVISSAGMVHWEPGGVFKVSIKNL